MTWEGKTTNMQTNRGIVLTSRIQLRRRSLACLKITYFIFASQRDLNRVYFQTLIVKIILVHNTDMGPILTEVCFYDRGWGEVCMYVHVSLDVDSCISVICVFDFTVTILFLSLIINSFVYICLFQTSIVYIIHTTTLNTRAGTILY